MVSFLKFYILLECSYHITPKNIIQPSEFDPNPDLETETFFSVSHCEHLQSAWQSHGKRRDCFGSLAMTISKSEFGI